MFGLTEKPKIQVVLSISNNDIRYVMVDRNDHGFFVVHHEEASLPEGIIEKGEILRAEALTTILKKVHDTIEGCLPVNKKAQYSLLLPHHYFRYEMISLEESLPEKKPQQFVADYLQENSDTYPWVTNHTYQFHYHEDDNELYIEALNSDIYTSYATVLSSAGFGDVTVTSNTTACGKLLSDQKTSQMVLFGEDSSYLIGYRNGHRIASQKFEISYQRFVADIVKSLSIDPDVARKIIREYGVSRAHKDEKVYNQLMRALTPLLDLLRKKRTLTKYPLYVWYLNTPIVAMEEVIEKRVGIEVSELNPLSLSLYPFNEVLTLHKHDSYRYSLLIAYALTQTKHI